VYRKPSNTNVITKPQSCQRPQIINSTFKGELCRAHRLCSSPEILQQEIVNILNIYEDNGHSRPKLTSIAESYFPPDGHPSNPNSGPAQQTQPPIETEEETTASLFTQLPLYYDDSTDQPNDLDPASQDLTPAEIVEMEKKPYVCHP
jgi:hypothetical protein